MNFGGLRPVFLHVFLADSAENLVDQEVSETEENKEEARPELLER